MRRLPLESMSMLSGLLSLGDSEPSSSSVSVPAELGVLDVLEAQPPQAPAVARGVEALAR